MKILAIDSATHQCSVAALNNGHTFHRSEMGAARHNRYVFAMCSDLLRVSGLKKGALDAIAYGRGPGIFTGVRVSLSLAQSLSFAWQIPLIPVSDLAAMAQRLASLSRARQFFVALDARMGEVYSCYFSRSGNLVVPTSQERLSSPRDVPRLKNFAGVAAGNAFKEYPELSARVPRAAVIDAELLPSARDMLPLAARDLLAGKTQSPREAAPLYLRNQIVRDKVVLAN